jgi:hypothetical protein
MTSVKEKCYHHKNVSCDICNGHTSLNFRNNELKHFYQKNKKLVIIGIQVHFNIISKPTILNSTSIQDSVETIPNGNALPFTHTYKIQ